MQNYYIRIEDMPSLVSHQLSIIKYVVLKKNFFFLCVDRLIWTWIWTRTSLDSDSNLFGLGLDSDSNLFGLGLVLDSTKVGLDYSPNPQYTVLHILSHCTFYYWFLFLFYSYLYLFSCVMFHCFIFIYFALSIERTCPDLHFTTDYTLYDCVCDK